MVFENVNFSDMIKQLEQMGFYEVILPFMLVFTIMFALLQKIKLFGQDTKNINIVVAVVIAFFFVRVPAIIATVNQFLPKISMIVIVLLMFLLILGVLGSGESTGWTGVLSSLEWQAQCLELYGQLSLQCPESAQHGKMACDYITGQGNTACSRHIRIIALDIQRQEN